MSLFEELRKLDAEKLNAAADAIAGDTATMGDTQAYWERIAQETPALDELSLHLGEIMTQGGLREADLTVAFIGVGLALGAIRGYAQAEQLAEQFPDNPPQPGL